MRRIKEYWVENSPPSSQPAKKQIVIFYEWIDSVMGAVIIIFFLFTFIFRTVGVDGTSMVPTLRDGNWVAVSGMNYTPKKGDIVVVTQPNDVHLPLIKRIIATGGDSIDIDFETHQVTVNNKVLKEPYINEPTARKFDVTFPEKVPKGFVFVMGDNRNASMDSRASGIGLIDERYILGKAEIKIFPIGKLYSESLTYI